MSAFDEAWGLIKAYTPNWREQAKNLPKIDEESVKEMMNPHDSAIGAGHSFRTYVHPSDPDFVAKVPKFEDWRMERGEEQLEATHKVRNRNGWGKDVFEFMESLGYPVASEYNAGSYLIQPRLQQVASHLERDILEENMRPDFGVANQALNHAIGDRGPDNWAHDQTGNQRMFDMDEQMNEPSDAYPCDEESWNADEGKSTGQFFQDELDGDKIQIPASKMLNWMDANIDPDEHSTQRTYLQHLEPYSDNPQKVLIGGKSPFLEGY